MQIHWALWGLEAVIQVEQEKEADFPVEQTEAILEGLGVARDQSRKREKLWRRDMDLCV